MVRAEKAPVVEFTSYFVTVKITLDKLIEYPCKALMLFQRGGTSFMTSEQLTKWIVEEIYKFPSNSKENYFIDSNKKIWGKPLIGFSRGDDPLFQFFKEDIGDFYWTPLDIFNLHYPQLSIEANQLTVISWVLPQTEQTKNAQRHENKYPAKGWVKSRIYGEQFNDLLRNYVVNILYEEGYEAIAPAKSQYWNTKKSERYGYASNWSERHVAFISGLGTFGLCDGLITKVGKAMRCGSVVAKITVKPTLRPYKKYDEYCLYYTHGICMKCAKRCPAGAITERGHDKTKCREYQSQFIKEYVKTEYHLNSGSCGLCQTSVPCESGIPLGKVRINNKNVEL